MGGAASVKKGFPVSLAVSELGGVPGCKAYHSSIFVGAEELSFSDDGIVRDPAGGSHGSARLQRIPMGSMHLSASELQEELEAHFAAGTYDLLRKNCNSFSEAALSLAVRKRLDIKYRQLEQLGARFPQLVATLSRGDYRPNPRADGFDLEHLCRDLSFAPSWVTHGHQVGGDTADRSSGQRTGKTAARGQPKRLVRAHILPFKDTFEFNFDHMYHNYVLPHVRDAAIADPKTGRGLHPGYEFSENGGRARFRVVVCEPAEGGLPNDSTVIFCEGEPIVRTLLTAVTILPLESSLPILKGKGPDVLAAEHVRPFLEQRSANIHSGQVFDMSGAKFKVVCTEPGSGGGPCITTKLTTKGAAVRVCTVDGCDGGPKAQCREKTCKTWVCAEHAAEVRELSCLCPTHAPRPGRKAVGCGLFGCGGIKVAP